MVWTTRMPLLGALSVDRLLALIVEAALDQTMRAYTVCLMPPRERVAASPPPLQAFRTWAIRAF